MEMRNIITNQISKCASGIALFMIGCNTGSNSSEVNYTLMPESIKQSIQFVENKLENKLEKFNMLVHSQNELTKNKYYVQTKQALDSYEIICNLSYEINSEIMGLENLSRKEFDFDKEIFMICESDNVLAKKINWDLKI